MSNWTWTPERDQPCDICKSKKEVLSTQVYGIGSCRQANLCTLCTSSGWTLLSDTAYVSLLSYFNILTHESRSA